MLRLTAILASVVIFAAVSASAPARAVKPKPCAVRHATLLARSGTTKLYSRDTNVDDLYGPTTTLYGCVGRHKPRALGDAYGIKAATLRINARYAAFSFAYTDNACTKYMQPEPTCAISGVQSYDLLAGKSRTFARNTVADALALTPAGWIAWVTPAPPMTAERTVLGLDSSTTPGAPRPLATGAIDPASLTASGETVSWTLAGAPQSATLAAR